MNKQKLFVTSCLSLVTTSMVFAIRGDVAGPMSAAFHITNEQLGLVFSPAFWAFTIAIFIGGALVDLVGMRSLHVLSSLGYIGGVLMVILAPHPTAPVASLFDNTGTTLLYAGFFTMGLSQGLVEAVINPLIVTIYSDEKTRKLTMLHAWWPGGQVIGGLLAVAMSKHVRRQLAAQAVHHHRARPRLPVHGDDGRRIPRPSAWPRTCRPARCGARRQSRCSSCLFVCMWMTAAAELGPDQWFPKVMGDLVPSAQPEQRQRRALPGLHRGLDVRAAHVGSAISHKSPLGTLIVCSFLTFVGLYWLGGLKPGDSAVLAFVAATIFGIGKTYFWPTMLGLTSEQFPRGGALLISLMGGTGMLSVAVGAADHGCQDRRGRAAARPEAARPFR